MIKNLKIKKTRKMKKKTYANVVVNVVNVQEKDINVAVAE